MAIIADYDDQPTSPSKSRPKSKPKPEPSKPKRPATTQNPTPNPFTFWFYLTITASIITFFFISFPSLSSPDPKTWFLNLPTHLRTHYSSGRTISVQINPNQPQVQVFTYSQGARNSENVLIVHGLGCSSFSFRGVVDGLASRGLFAAAIDLPGSGFSDKTIAREESSSSSRWVLGALFEVYEEIKEKGIFWGFDSLIEHGHLPYEELNKPKTRVSKHMVVVPLDLGANEVGRVIGQAVSTMGLGPVHLVLHDSALVMCANWVVENSGLVRSVTLLDSLPKEVALPLVPFKMPVVKEIILGVDYLFGRLISKCCSRSSSGSSVQAHRVLLKGRDGGVAAAAIVGTLKKLNHSFELGEWVNMDGIKGLPMQVLWSGTWSEEWSEEGKWVADVVSQGKFSPHSGGRWPQEDTSSEIAQNIYRFVSSLPKTERKPDYETFPEHTQKKRDEAKAAGRGPDGNDYDHGAEAEADAEAEAGYMDAYGLRHGHGHGWGM